MQIDTEHFHHWMRAVRESPDPMRTMDAFWRGQILSKEWLITELKNQKQHIKQWPSIDIHGGWVGTLASLLFQSDLYISNIRSVDIDPNCEEIARTMNQIEMEAGKFRAITADMCAIRSDADIIINTSFEHISQEEYDLWLSGMPQNSVIVLQSNNYAIPEHVRIANDLEEFKLQSGLENILYAGELSLPLYKRFMIIGKKHVSI
jgi:hypothetical protein